MESEDEKFFFTFVDGAKEDERSNIYIIAEPIPQESNKKVRINEESRSEEEEKKEDTVPQVEVRIQEENKYKNIEQRETLDKKPKPPAKIKYDHLNRPRLGPIKIGITKNEKNNDINYSPKQNKNKIRPPNKSASPSARRKRFENPPPSPKTARKEKLFNEFMMNPISLPSNPEDLTFLLQKLKLMYEKASKNQDFDLLERLAKMIHSVEIKISREEKNRQQETYERTARKHGEIVGITKALVDDWNQKYDLFVQKTQENVDRIAQQNSEELEAFDETIPQQIPPQYRQMSQELRRLREHQHLLARKMMFARAEKLKEIADRRQRMEEAAAFSAAMRDFRKKRDLLIQKHQRRLSAYLAHAESTQILMLKQRDELIGRLCKRIEISDMNVERLRRRGCISARDVRQCIIDGEKQKMLGEKEVSMVTTARFGNRIPKTLVEN